MTSDIAVKGLAAETVSTELGFYKKHQTVSYKRVSLFVTKRYMAKLRDGSIPYSNEAGGSSLRNACQTLLQAWCHDVLCTSLVPT